MLCSRLKERLSQLTDRHKGPCETSGLFQTSLFKIRFIAWVFSVPDAAIEVINFPPGSRGKREQLGKSVRFTAGYVDGCLLKVAEVLAC